MNFPPIPSSTRRTRRSPLLAAAALTWLMGVGAHSAHAQRASFEGSSIRQHEKTQEDRMLDLNGDGKVDDNERALAMTYLRSQIGMDDYGQINEETRRSLRAKRKQLQAEARARDKAEAVVEKLRERQAKGRALTEAELAQIRAADVTADTRRRENDRLAREAAAKAPTTQAAQLLSKPIIDSDRR